MDLQKILERENDNSNHIYLYVDLENNLCIAYEFSAYLLTCLFNTLKLDEDVRQETGIYFYVTKIPLRFVIDHFNDRNTSIGEEFIKVTLNDIYSCSNWRDRFDQQKKDWNKIYKIVQSL